MHATGNGWDKKRYYCLIEPLLNKFGSQMKKPVAYATGFIIK